MVRNAAFCRDTIYRVRLKAGRFLLIYPLILLIFGLVTATPAAANDGIPNNCEHPNGAYNQPNHFVRYEPQHERVVLVDWDTGDTLQILESSLEPLPLSSSGKPYYTFNWSPDCRYVMIIWGIKHAQSFVWDVVSGQRAGSFAPDGGVATHYVDWSPDSQQVMMDTAHVPYSDMPDVFYLWTIASDQKIRLTEPPLGIFHVTWDVERGQVFAQPYLYDRFTGQVIGTFHNLIPIFECDFYCNRYMFSPDGNKLAIYAHHAAFEGLEINWENRDFRYNAITVWNRDGSNPVAIRAAADGYGYWPRIAFSADNRYMAAGGRYQVRVWDLQNLSADVSQPNYRLDGPVSGVRGVTFIDDTTIETYTRSGYQRWNFSTGELLSNPGA